MTTMLRPTSFLLDRRRNENGGDRCWRRPVSIGALLLLLLQFVDCFTVRPHTTPCMSSTMGQAKGVQLRNRVLLHMDNDDDDDFAYDDDDDDELLSREEIEALTVPQLKQQLRLRGLKVSGKKQELLDRLLRSSSKWRPEPVGSEDDGGSSSSQPLNGTPQEPEVIAADPKGGAKKKKTKAQKLAEEKGKEFIDVTAYLDEDDQGKDVKTSMPVEKDEEDDPESDDPEVWGSAAKIVD
eukprot:CAMPEP_0117055420 /NCGR_PEP_ID=MMETSP0472-20121206/38417_1 /TAXON_ID=693140 ORGANISM="Tiarina fusus, Strain LIS" /NCGR_SAMPLE_ID=MMETSP0472 /ASSEMBLY_ACC=CAM_ASM_000603 /LENGTH=237 /DNA_ID=CAMNT_0004771405 /DNA_START=87 /DNA_END=797 /DNA_ORIENTATION=+